MAITVDEIVKKGFSRVMRGYSMDEVDDFLDYLVEEVDALLKENASLSEELKGKADAAVPAEGEDDAAAKLSQELEASKQETERLRRENAALQQELGKCQDDLEAALAHVEKAGDPNAQAEQIIAAAKSKAEEIVNAAKAEAEAISVQPAQTAISIEPSISEEALGDELRRVLLTAERTATSVVEGAKAEAAGIVENANQEAKTLVENAQNEVTAIKQESELIRTSAVELREKYRSMLEAQLEMLSNRESIFALGDDNSEE